MSASEHTSPTVKILDAKSDRKSASDVFTTELDALLNDYLASSKESMERERLRDKIVAHIQPYVKKVAYGLARRNNDPVEDLIQVGMMGVLKALEKYNPLAGSSFKTYSTYFITGEIRHYLRDKAHLLKAPRQMYELYYRMNQIVQHLTKEFGRSPTDEEIADWLDCPISKIEAVQDAERRKTMISLDDFIVSGGGENASGGDTVHIERLVDERYNDFTHRHEDRMMLQTALDNLKEELRDVVRMSFFEDKSQSEIADVLGISQMQVSRRLRKALDELSVALSPVGRE